MNILEKMNNSMEAMHTPILNEAHPDDVYYDSPVRIKKASKITSMDMSDEDRDAYGKLVGRTGRVKKISWNPAEWGARRGNYSYEVKMDDDGDEWTLGGGDFDVLYDINELQNEVDHSVEVFERIPPYIQKKLKRAHCYTVEVEPGKYEVRCDESLKKKSNKKLTEAQLDIEHNPKDRAEAALMSLKNTMNKVSRLKLSLVTEYQYNLDDNSKLNRIADFASLLDATIQGALDEIDEIKAQSEQKDDEVEVESANESLKKKSNKSLNEGKSFYIGWHEMTIPELKKWFKNNDTHHFYKKSNNKWILGSSENDPYSMSVSPETISLLKKDKFFANKFYE